MIGTIIGAIVVGLIVGALARLIMHADLHLIVDGVADLDLVDPERGIEFPQQSPFGLHESRS